MRNSLGTKLPLAPPPRDSNGHVVPHDHQGIRDDDGVIRRVSPHHLVDDPKAGGKRLSSMAFQPSSGANGGMSVDLQALIEEDGLDARAYVIAPPWIGAVRFTAGGLRSESLKVGFDPRPALPYHGQGWGHFTNSLPRRLAKLAQTFVAIEGLG